MVVLPLSGGGIRPSEVGDRGPGSLVGQSLGGPGPLGSGPPPYATSMRVTYIFPIIDARILLSESPAILPVPNWGAVVPGQYLRGFGGMEGRSRGDELADPIFCHGHRALRFGALPPCLVSSDEHALPRLVISGTPRKTSRRLFYDQHFTARFELSFELPPFAHILRRGALIERPKWRGRGRRLESIDTEIVERALLMPIIQHLSEIPVHIAPGYSNAATAPIADVGQLLARHFAQATLSRRGISDETMKRQERLCRAGRPMVIVRLVTTLTARSLNRLFLLSSARAQSIAGRPIVCAQTC
jgi:hypothetical protein